MNLKEIQVIAFDADDTLWENENFFRDAELEFCQVMAEFVPVNETVETLYRIEMQNMELYGYGIKAFMLSLIETSLVITEKK
jgi:putative hydrolase of the HAD superfamily